jgi:HAD superfamily hydrolase (TIGR01484 family)
MRPLSDFPLADRRGAQALLCDLDDTLTTHGSLSPETYQALARLRAAGLIVAVVTGRPAGWCDLIARLWPVDAAVGENGALYFRADHATKRLRRVYRDDDETRAEHRRRLDDLAREILRKVPGAALSTDQAYRETDLAIDYRELVEPLPREEVDYIASLIEAAGGETLISSIHIHARFSKVDKMTMARRLLAEEFGLDVETGAERVLFVGDSTNDAAMFSGLPNTIGVANVAEIVDRLPRPPRYVTRGRAGAGFVELADAILEARA